MSKQIELSPGLLRAVMRCLLDVGAPMTPEAIAEVCALPTEDVRVALRQMTVERVAEAVDGGAWDLVW